MALKDFMHAFFKEEVEEEVVEAAPEQEEAAPEVVATTITEVVEEAPVYLRPVQPEPEPVKKSGPSIFTGLDIANVSQESRQPEPKKTAKPERPKPQKSTKPVNEEYQSVISPIFGNTHDDEKEFDKVHNAVELPRPEAGFEMTTVISPMFGSDLPQPGQSAAKKAEPAAARPVSDLLETSEIVEVSQDSLLKDGQ